MLVQALSEVKIDMLKNHDFLPWRNVVTLSCTQREDGDYSERMEIAPVISIDPHGVLDIHTF